MHEWDEDADALYPGMFERGQRIYVTNGYLYPELKDAIDPGAVLYIATEDWVKLCGYLGWTTGDIYVTLSFEQWVAKDLSKQALPPEKQRKGSNLFQSI